MPRLYRGMTTTSRGLKKLSGGVVERYTWLTDNPEEAKAYAKLKSEGGHGGKSETGGKPVVVAVDVPEGAAWELGGGGFGMSSKYYKTHKRLRTRVETLP